MLLYRWEQARRCDKKDGNERFLIKYFTAEWTAHQSVQLDNIVAVELDIPKSLESSV